MTLFSYILAVIMAFLVVKTTKKWRDGHLSFAETMAWDAFWVVVAVIAFIPRVTTTVANAVGVGRGADLLVYLALLALFYVAFRLYNKVERIEEDITSLVRELAIEQADDDD